MKLGQLLGFVGGHFGILGDDKEAGDVFDKAQRGLKFADVGGVDGELEEDVMPLTLLLDGVGELSAAPGVGGVDLATVRADTFGNGVDMGGGEFGDLFDPIDHHKLVSAHRRVVLSGLFASRNSRPGATGWEAAA